MITSPRLSGIICCQACNITNKTPQFCLPLKTSWIILISGSSSPFFCKAQRKDTLYLFSWWQTMSKSFNRIINSSIVFLKTVIWRSTKDWKIFWFATVSHACKKSYQGSQNLRSAKMKLLKRLLLGYQIYQKKLWWCIYFWIYQKINKFWFKATRNQILPLKASPISSIIFFWLTLFKMPSVWSWNTS